MTENACKSLRFNAMPAITTRFGRKRRTLEMWPSRRSLRGRRNRGRGGEGPKLPNFFLLPSLPLPFPAVFCESLFFRIKMTSAVKRSRTVALSAERVLKSLEQKGDGNDGMSSGEESDLYRQLQHTDRGINCPT